MKKFLIFTPIFLFADVLQLTYQNALKNVLDENSVVLNSFILLFAIFSACFLFMIIKFKKNMLLKDKKQEIHSISALGMKPMKYKITQVDILRTLDFYFSILHTKACKHNNVVFFNFNPMHPRIVKMDCTNVQSMFYFLIEFVLDCTKDTNIETGLRLKGKNAASIQYEFFIRIDKVLDCMKEGNIKNTLVLHEKILFYKKLAQAQKLATQLKTNIIYKAFQRHSIFTVSCVFDNTTQIQNTKIPVLQKANAIILESSKAGFFNLSTKLSKLGLNSQLRYDLDIAKKHLFSMVFSPSYVFINTRILRSFTKDDMQKFQHSLKNHKFKIILISDNASYDNFVFKDEPSYLLKQPFTIDTLKAAIDASTPPPRYKNIAD